ncbi:MAG: M20/M25/M40 family metallo-hydrolase [Clostridia bacterium]|nr:M20/M25/M40 family metallo-hydrolase [Clostridia bacterium]
MEILKKLADNSGISGYENEFAKSLQKMLESYCSQVEINKTGSVVANFRNYDDNKKTILLEAHLDRIGLVVSEILENGFLKFKALGGVDDRTLPASEIYVLGKESIFGVIGALPPHLKSGSSDDGFVKIQDMMIDTGFSKEELKDKISVGDPVLLKCEFCELLGSRVSSAALDNRAGIAAILCALDMLKTEDLKYNIKIAFTVGEELGLLGARTIDCEDVDLAIVVDVTHGKTPDAKPEGTFVLGSGAIICRGPNLDFGITKKVIETAEKQGILHDIEVSAGNTGTNAWVIQTLEQGIRCVLLSIPLRYMHTAVETIDTDDVKSVAKLIAECVKGGDLLA